MATGWIVLVGPVSVASAQSDAASGANSFNECGALCRFFRGVPAAQPAQDAQPSVQVDEQPDVGRRRSQASAAQRRSSAKARQAGSGSAGRRPLAISPADVEQTSAVSTKPDEVLFLSGADDVHRRPAEDLAGIIGPDLPLRVVPGNGRSIHDVLTLPDVDLAVVSSLAVERGTAYSDRLVYVSKLFTEELHALTAANVKGIADLAGKPVYLGPQDSDGEAAARVFLEARGIAVSPVAGSFASALAGLREGRIAAAFILAPKPYAPLAELRGAGGLRLLPLAYRASDPAFYPAAFTAADYPGLIGEKERIETVALDAILVAPRWRENTPRQRELTAFSARFLDRLGNLTAAGRHPKWRETNPAAAVEGLQRFRPAQQWVAARLKAREAGSARRSDSRVAGETR
jgi:hypothetical protein